MLGNGWGVASIVVRDLDTHLIQGSHVYRIVARAGRLHQLEARTQPSELDIEAAVRHERRDSVLHHFRLPVELAVAVDPIHPYSRGRERPHSLERRVIGTEEADEMRHGDSPKSCGGPILVLRLLPVN